LASNELFLFLIHFGWEREKLEKIKVYKLENEFLKVELLNLGATIKKLEVKDKNGNFRNVVLGFDDIEKYRENPAYFGAIIGRTAGKNRR